MLLTKNVTSMLKKEKKDEIEELCTVAQRYLEASQALTVIGKQLCDSLIKVSSSTQSHDVGKALNEVAQHQKQTFLQRAKENDMLRKGVIQATQAAQKSQTQDVKKFEKKLANAGNAIGKQIKRQENVARKLRGRGDAGQRATQQLQSLKGQRDKVWFLLFRKFVFVVSLSSIVSKTKGF